VFTWVPELEGRIPEVSMFLDQFENGTTSDSRTVEGTLSVTGLDG